ncbi:BTAD domain-containing putative transcriptional regulator [Actinoallomurus bryophytorum]|uniref:Putative ATPase n=1 Tax=Actinoallomurus bryophytorum TaxID=1490222 RepID=A0A543CEA2_9ACTN|nr:BTAD domain-containing putative transcriptional regulator [Actinoallomurus bryophytorum]TQL95422.1 putative ATPase [Actinoallomurus bryophytorum]
MRVAMLGPLRVRGEGDRPIEVGGARLRLLLIRLALDPGRVVTADRLAEDLWGDDLPVDPAGALQTLVARLRRAFGSERAVIVSHPAGYLLDVAPDGVDVWMFERAAEDGHAALEAGDPERAGVVLRAGLELWRGTPFADAGGALFAMAPAARLEETRLAMIEDRIDADLAAGTHVPVAEVEEPAREHPLRERLHARLVRVLCAADRRAEALEAYERIRHDLAERLGVDPGPELRAAHLAALRTERAPRRGGLPARATGFVGRDTELAALRAALEESRLVTITGFGGTGKTRLALEAASGLSRPVRLVELGSVADPARVVPAVVATVGDDGVFGTDTGRPPLERLASMLTGHDLLLILDNCEHVIDAAAGVAEHLLAAAPDVTILATSREPLAIGGETLFPLSPLGLPEPGTDPRAAPAVALFAERAAAVRPGFTVNEDVAHICRELEGIPLAIELAAARLRSLTVGQLTERIGDRFGLLERGSRTAQPRHRTLRAVVDWSWELLDEAEREVLRRLSVFFGGATVAAVTSVCEPARDTVDLLAGLVDKSLLLMTEDEQDVRYRLLDTVREYARERLEQAGEAGRVRAAHAGFYAGFAETAEPRLRGGDQLLWLARLDAEQGNLDAALGHAIESGRHGTALRLIIARTWPWVMRGRRREAEDWARAVLAAVGDDAPPGHELAHGMCVLIAAAEDSSGVQRALEVVNRSDRPAALGAWTIAGGHMGQAAVIRAHASEVAERLGASPDPWLRAMAGLASGLVRLEFTSGGAGEAEEHLRAAEEGFTAVGDRWGEAVTLFALGMVLANRGSWSDTVRVLERARARAAAVGGVEEIPAPMMLLVQLGQARTRAGDRAGARTDLERALVTAERGGDALALARVRHALGDLAYADGDPDGAARCHRAALACVREAPKQFLALLHMSAACAEAALGDDDRAGELASHALTLIAGSGDDVARATVLEGAACRLRHDDAVAVLSAARTLRGIEDTADPGVRALLDRCRAELGEERFAAAWSRVLSSPESFARQASARR